MKAEILRPTFRNSNISVHRVVCYKEDSPYDWHIHPECEMYICFEGRITFWAGNETYDLYDGDILVVNANIPHKTFSYKHTKGFLIQFDPDFDNTLYESFSDCPCVVFRNNAPYNKPLRSCLEKIIEENTNKAKAYDKYIKAAVWEIKAILSRAEFLPDNEEFLKSKEMVRLTPVLDYVEKHYNENISLDIVSRVMNIDKSHFCRIFKSTTGTSFVKYLNLVRLNKAEKLLTETNESIYKICDEVGFSSPAYFTKIFKENKFCSPLAYRKMKRV